MLKTLKKIQKKNMIKMERKTKRSSGEKKGPQLFLEIGVDCRTETAKKTRYFYAHFPSMTQSITI